MSIRLVSGQDVTRLLPMEACIEAVANALTATARGEAVFPLRSVLRLPDRRGVLAIMPGLLGTPRSLGLKAISVVPGNAGTSVPSHQGVVLLFDADRGSPIALLDAAGLTAVRTAAASGVATRLLARPEAGDLAILGSGVQAGTHVEAMQAVRSLRRVRVWSRTPEHARAFAEAHSPRLGLPVEVCADAGEAVRGADLVCTTTDAREPVLLGRWLAPGSHVNAVGACFPTHRELDTEAMLRARVYTDCRESLLHEAGDFLIPRGEGAFGDDHLVGEVGEVLLDRAPGRGSAEEITVFESLGIAVEDLAAGEYVYRRALETGAGTEFELGEARSSAR